MLFLPVCFPALILAAQSPKTSPEKTTAVGLSTEKALAYSEQGRCKEALPALKRAMNPQTALEIRKKAGLVGLRCSLALDDRDSASDFAKSLNKQFNDDPDVLFVLVHAYSDLSIRAAQDLGRKAPQSIPAHKLNAESWEAQGKWLEAEREYENMIEKDPTTPGIHFLLGRLLLSQPHPEANSVERAKHEFQKEVEIDPRNAGAHYVLGELANKEENWQEAITQFSEASKLDPTFAAAYVGWGFALITVSRFEEAIAPLREAERMTPANPSVHYGLATALTRLGRREEAAKEFEIHSQLMQAKAPPPANEQQPH